MKDLIGMTLPTCEILVNGQKRKLYGKKKNKVYLHKGDNFQLNLFNPLQERIGVQLRMNGIKVDNDILVLNPGQNVVVERFIGTNRKLTFSTYEIDATNKEAVKAIEKNGVLEVVFWNEKIQTNYINITNTTTSLYSNITSGSTITIGGNSGDIILTGNVKINGTLDINNGALTVSNNSGTSGSSGTGGVAGASGKPGKSARGSADIGSSSPGIFTYDADQSFVDFNSSNSNSRTYDTNRYTTLLNQNGMGSIGIGINSPGTSLNNRFGVNPNAKWAPIIENKPKLETGRIEKGAKSDQCFSSVAFEVGEEFYKIKFKLLPFSLRPVKKNSMIQQR